MDRTTGPFHDLRPDSVRRAEYVHVGRLVVETWALSAPSGYLDIKVTSLISTVEFADA